MLSRWCLSLFAPLYALAESRRVKQENETQSQYNFTYKNSKEKEETAVDAFGL